MGTENDHVTNEIIAIATKLKGDVVEELSKRGSLAYMEMIRSLLASQEVSKRIVTGIVAERGNKSVGDNGKVTCNNLKRWESK